MPNISFDKWRGIDRRKGRSVSDAEALWVLSNAYINTGKVINKRPGLSLVTTLTGNTKGLFSANGKLNVFYGDVGGTSHADFNAIQLGTTELDEVNFADVFNGSIYAAVTEIGGTTKHYYNSALVTDVNCPNTKVCIKIGSKIYAVSTSGNVRFCSTADPSDWTAVDDAGFINTGNQTPGDPEPKAFGVYAGSLCVFGLESVQLWTVDPDPTNIAIQKTVSNIGCNFNETPVNVSGDLYFLTDYGVRSIATQAYTDLLYDVDIGAHIDDLVTAELATTSATPQAVFYQGGKQFWLVIGAKVFVYTFSRSSKVSAWSVYSYPFSIDSVAEYQGELYLRSGNSVYKVDGNVFSDNGVNYQVDIETTFQSFGKPGQLKHIIGFDAVVEGSADIQFMTDVNNDSQITGAVTVQGDTRPYGTIPIELMGTEIAAKISNNDANDFAINLLSFYYSTLGVV